MPALARSGQRSRALWAAAEPFVLGVLFTVEGRAALAEIGVAGRAGYFAIRAAPMGRAPAPVAAAAFHGFPAMLLDAVLTPVWSIVTPGAVIAAHQDSIPRTAARAYGDAIDMTALGRLADLLTALVADLDTAGRPLAAANQAVNAPDEPWARFWRACTTLREYRGDGHIAALVAADLDIGESLVLTATWAAPNIDAALLRTSRRLTDDAWARASERLTHRGLLDHGELTQPGRALRDEIERRTDQASARPWSQLSDADCAELYDLCTTLSSRLLGTGTIRAVTPVGAPWPPPPLAG